jgi:hypothetical protein
MHIFFYANIGARDVMLDGKDLRPARPEGFRILENFTTFTPRLSLPILEPTLRFLLQKHPAGIQRIVLFGTDQVNEEWKKTDTLHFADICVLKIRELFKEQIEVVERKLVQKITPSLYDEAFEAYDALLGAETPANDDIIYVLITGGVPACNTALLLQSVQHFGVRLRTLYKIEDVKDPQPMRAPRQLLDTFRRSTAVEHLRRLDFANALPFMVNSEVPLDAQLLTQYAAQRFAFDFQAANQSLEKAMMEGSTKIRDFIQSNLRHSLDPLFNPQAGSLERLETLLIELYYNAAITYDHCRYADFLGRVYRFQEALLRSLVERILGLPTDLGKEVRSVNQKAWEAKISANQYLLDFLQAQKLEENRSLDWHEISRPTYKALLSYCTSSPSGLDQQGKPYLSEKEHNRYELLIKRINRLDPLIELRHRTIIGHDFEGVSEELLLRTYPEGRPTPVDGLREVLGIAFQRSFKENPYQRIAEAIIEHIETRRAL